MITVQPLNQTPELIPTVAAWIWNAFWSDGGGRGFTQTEIASKLALATDDTLPMAWVAWHQDTPVGCVNLIDNDDPDREHLRPWLAALYVEPPFRKLGAASSLITKVLESAARLGEKTCYLGTDIPAFYLKQGASIVEHEEDTGHYVMAFEMGRASV